MSLRDRGLEIDKELVRTREKWKTDIQELTKIIEEQDAILRSDEAQTDRSENAVYTNAVATKQEKDSQRKVYEERVAGFDKAYAEYCTENYQPEGKIKIGSVVSFKVTETGREFIVKIVPRRSDAPLLGAISETSPVGRELMGKKQGDIAICRTERGIWKYNIQEVY